MSPGLAGLCPGLRGFLWRPRWFVGFFFLAQHVGLRRFSPLRSLVCISWVQRGEQWGNGSSILPSSLRGRLGAAFWGWLGELRRFGSPNNR